MIAMRNHVLPLLICLLMTLGAAPALGQTNTDDPLIDLDFKGGTAVDYIEAVHDAAGDVNIIVEEGVDRFTVGAMELRRAPLSSALKYLDRRELSTDGRHLRLHVRAFPPRSGGETVYAVSTQQYARRGSAQNFAPSRPISHVWTLADILESDVPPTDVLAAIETALMLFGDEYEPAQIRFHEETQLLIARGHSDQIETIDDVVDELRATVAYQHNQARRQQNEQSAAKRAKTLEVELDAAKANAAGLERALIEARTRNDVLQQELNRAQETHEMMLHDLRTKLTERDRQVAVLEQTMATLRAELKRLKEGSGR